MKKPLILVLVFLGIVTLGSALWFSFSKGDQVSVQSELPKVRTIVETVSASGKIQPEVEVKITTEVSGQIISLPVREGDLVKKGELLVQINPDLYESAVNRANAALNQSKSNLSSAKARKAQAQAQFNAAERSFNRSERLFEQEAISQADFDQALSSFEVSKAEVSAASESIKSAEFQILSANASKTEASDNLSRTTLIAPQDGIVTALTKEEGESVLGTSMMQGETIMKVSNLSNMEVNVEVNESDIVKVSVGDTAKVEVDAYLDQEFTGIVTEISNTALNALSGGMMSMDQVTNFSVKVRILPSSYTDLVEGKPANYSPFRPGMSATVEIQTSRRNGITIPVRAVTTRTDTTSGKRRFGSKRNATDKETTELKEPILCVFVNNNGKSEIREVKTDIQDSKYILITSGLKPEDEVITGPYDQVSRKLRPGTEIENADHTESKE